MSDTKHPVKGQSQDVVIFIYIRLELLKILSIN